MKKQYTFTKWPYQQGLLPYQKKLKPIPKSKRNTSECVKNIIWRYYNLICK